MLGDTQLMCELNHMFTINTIANNERVYLVGFKQPSHCLNEHPQVLFGIHTPNVHHNRAIRW